MILWEEDEEPDYTIIERGRLHSIKYEVHEEGRWTGHPLQAFLYRYKDPYIGYNPILVQFRVLKETPKGYWIYDRDYDKNRWSSKKGKKKYAYLNKEDALYAYYRKKLEHLRHLENKHDQIKAIVRNIEREHEIFGAHRPMVNRLNEISNILVGTKLEPLKKVRPRKEFIEEGEMIV